MARAGEAGEKKGAWKSEPTRVLVNLKNLPLLRCRHTMYNANINKNNRKLLVTTFLNYFNSDPTTLITLDLL